MIQNTGQLIENIIKKFEEKSDRKKITGVPSGFIGLDKLTKGWQPGELIVIAAPPGMGKKAFILSMVKNQAIVFNQSIALFSLECTSERCITRMISSESGIPSGKLISGNLELFEIEILKSSLGKLSEAPIYIDDTPSLSVDDLRSKLLQLSLIDNINLIVIDYLQLMTLNNTYLINREEELDAISRNLRAFAREINIPIIILSNLSDNFEIREGSKRPILSDLQEVCTIDQYADIVTFIYRPQYYGLFNWDDEQKMSCEGEAEIIVAQNKNGGLLDNIRLKFTGHLAHFSDFD